MKISVIVPVYNSEKYVARCIDSVIAQTYHNWELLLIDDGSTDSSPDILRAYESRDARISVYRQANAGAGAARNLGIKKAAGDYIVFVDSDDTIESHYFALLSKKNTDVVFIGVNQRDSAYNITLTEKLPARRGLSKDDIIRSQMTGKFPWGGWRKAVRADVLRKNAISYTNHQIGEEAVYSFLLLWYAKDFSFIDKPVYNYIQHDDSLSNRLLDDPWGDVAIAVRNKVVELNIYRQFAATINAFILTAAAVSLDKMARKYPASLYRQKARERISRMKSELDRCYAIDYRHMKKKAVLLSPFLKSGLVMPVYMISRIKNRP